MKWMECKAKWREIQKFTTMQETIKIQFCQNMTTIIFRKMSFSFRPDELVKKDRMSAAVSRWVLAG